VASPTEPRIFEAQNTTDARRLVAAQARMYSDAKMAFGLRMVAVFALAIATSVVALSFPALRTAMGGGGGVFILALSLVVGGLEKRVRFRAAAVQEQFDTQVFQLPWNALYVDRPPQHMMTRAAQRYRGGRDKDWYSDTQGVHRPFDVLVCQSTNFGWGARMHRLWMWPLAATTLVLCIAIVIIWHILALSGPEGFAALIAPSLGPLKELAEQIRENWNAAATKENAERKLAELWDMGMDGRHNPTIAELRSIQDRAVTIRQGNPYIPDWFDRLFHGSNQAAMSTSTIDRITQAKRHGHAD
jgi:hypothetical protein